jgi:hypothetical protein
VNWQTSPGRPCLSCLAERVLEMHSESDEPMMLLLDGHLFQIPPFRPGAIIFADIAVTQQLRQDEPDMSGRPAKLAVGDYFFVWSYPQTIEYRVQFIRRSKCPIQSEGRVSASGVKVRKTTD